MGEGEKGKGEEGGKAGGASPSLREPPSLQGVLPKVPNGQYHTWLQAKLLNHAFQLSHCHTGSNRELNPEPPLQCPKCVE